MSIYVLGETKCIQLDTEAKRMNRLDEKAVETLLEIHKVTRQHIIRMTDHDVDMIELSYKKAWKIDGE